MEFYSFKKKMQLESKKLRQEKNATNEFKKTETKENGMKRLFCASNKKKEGTQSLLKIDDDNIMIQNEKNQKLFHDLSKCKTKKE